MAAMIRPARLEDVADMVALSEQKRLEYETYQPIFWRKAVDSASNQLPYFENLLTRDNIIALVYEGEMGIKGFIIAAIVGAPPVYDPGGLTCMIDDFCVSATEGWGTVGKELLAEAGRQAKARGALQHVVVCGHLDQPKRAMLRAAGLTIASEWYTGVISEE